jgi:biopolymer transport protein ExbD
MRRRLHRRRPDKQPADINITAFMNLMVILVPFLLITAVFTRMTVLELNLPAASEHENIQEPLFDLEIIVRGDNIAVGDRQGGLVKRLPKVDGDYDYEQLSLLLRQIKARFPDKLDATLLLESDTPYDILVQVMDRVRVTQFVEAGSVQSAELFPEISIGDAPITSVRMAGK